MYIITLIIAYQCGTCSEVDKRMELCIPAIRNDNSLMLETMALVGAILAILSEIFADSAGGIECYQMASVKITVGCGSHISTLYNNQDCTIPCNGRRHLIWLNDIRNSIKTPLNKFLINVALKPSDGTRL